MKNEYKILNTMIISIIAIIIPIFLFKIIYTGDKTYTNNNSTKNIVKLLKNNENKVELIGRKENNSDNTNNNPINNVTQNNTNSDANITDNNVNRTDSAVKKRVIETVNFRIEPKIENNIIGTIGINEEVEIIEEISIENSDWVKVKYNGKIGYISKQFLSDENINDNSNLEN